MFVCASEEGTGILLAYMISKTFEILFIVSLGKEEIMVKDFPSLSLSWLCFF